MAFFTSINLEQRIFGQALLQDVASLANTTIIYSHKCNGQATRDITRSAATALGVKGYLQLFYKQILIGHGSMD